MYNVRIALHPEVSVIVKANVVRDAAGVPHDCVVNLSSTFAELDARICEIVEARMRFAPAQNAGQHVAAVYSGRIRWKLDGTARPPFGFVVTTAGRAEQCQIERPSAIARSVDVCAMIFPAQADGQPQFSPGMAQNGSLSLSIYARPRPDAIAPSAGLVRP